MSLHLTLSWWRPLSYRNQSIDFLRKSMGWFLYDKDLRHERVKSKERFKDKQTIIENLHGHECFRVTYVLKSWVLWKNIYVFTQKMPDHILQFLFKWKGVQRTYKIKYIKNEISSSTPNKQTKKERERSKNSSTSKTSILKLLKIVTSY